MVTLLANLFPLVVRPQAAFALKVCSVSRFCHRAAPPLMAAHDNPGETSHNTVNHTPAVGSLQEFFHSNPDGWERCWEEGLTPWDLGKPTPILQQLLQADSLPKGRALIPGCGSGYDVVTLASSERYVVGLDLSEVALKKAKELAASSPNANYCSFLQADFFTWEPTQLFDLIFDYTFFCAIVPDKRSAWASRMSHLLKPDGELITLMFPIDDHDGGPPYKTSVADYEEVLHPQGFHAISIVENELAVNPRKGREKLGRWRKMTKDDKADGVAVMLLYPVFAGAKTVEECMFEGDDQVTIRFPQDNDQGQGGGAFQSPIDDCLAVVASVDCPSFSLEKCPSAC